MSKRFLYLAVAIMTVFIASCEKNDPIIDDENVDDKLIIGETIVLEIANIEGVPSDIATVKIVMNAVRENSQGQVYDVRNVVASSKVENGSIKLNFPASVPERYLGSMQHNLSIFSFEGLAVSDTQAKMGGVFIPAYDSAGQFIGSFGLEGSGWMPAVLFSDRSFTMKGHLQNGLEIDLRFDKGVNVTFLSIWDGNFISTTQRPLGVNFEWVFRPPPPDNLLPPL